jgi:hypothetical protein
MIVRRLALACSLALSLGLVACDDDATSGGPPGTSGGSAQKFFLGTGEPDNTSAPRVEIDAAGGLHAVYPAYAGGRAYYAYCAKDCTPEGVKVVRFDTSGTVGNAMIALDPSGKPRLLLSSYSKVYYAACEGDCTTRDGWSLTELVDHGGEKEVTGEAFALDPAGRPRFLMHTYVAYLGIGQKPPVVHWVACDAACNDARSWSAHAIGTQMWQGSTLRFDKEGRAKVATVVTLDASPETGGSQVDAAAYVECNGDCTKEASWSGTALMPIFQSVYEAVPMDPTVSLALTKDGAPRLLALGKKEDGSRAIAYFACDAGCTGDAWKGTILSDHAKLGAGLDLALDAEDHPRFVYTLDYNIALASCDDADCTRADAPWKLTKVEYGGEMKPDQIFLYDNCNVGAWFLHGPSLALTAEGAPRVGYQARDISGGWTNPDPSKPRCVAGTDMTWTRLAVMAGL